MYLQVTNLKKEKFNQIQTTPSKMFKDVKNQGWNMKDCSVKELRKELVENVYKSPDGKNTTSCLR